MYLVGYHWGVAGVAAFSAVSVYLLQTPGLMIAIGSKGPVTRKMLAFTLFEIMLAASASAASGLLVKYYLNSPSIIQLAVAFPLAYVSYLSITLISPGGRAMLSLVRESMDSLIKRRLQGKSTSTSMDLS